MPDKKKWNVNRILAHSYSVYLFSLMVGLVFDYFYPIRVIPLGLEAWLGLPILLLSPLFIFWAQFTSKQLSHKKEKLTQEDFKRGPYAFTRGPTHLGLAFLVTSYGILANSVIIIFMGVFAYFISKHIFLKEEENLLADRYGAEYLEYKKSVDPWF